MIKRTLPSKTFFPKNRPDIVLIQETKKQVVDRKCLSTFWGSHNRNWNAIPPIVSAGGLLIM